MLSLEMACICGTSVSVQVTVAAVWGTTHHLHGWSCDFHSPCPSPAAALTFLKRDTFPSRHPVASSDGTKRLVGIESIPSSPINGQSKVTALIFGVMALSPKFSSMALSFGPPSPATKHTIDLCGSILNHADHLCPSHCPAASRSAFHADDLFQT